MCKTSNMLLIIPQDDQVESKVAKVVQALARNGLAVSPEQICDLDAPVKIIMLFDLTNEQCKIVERIEGETGVNVTVNRDMSMKTCTPFE